MRYWKNIRMAVVAGMASLALTAAAFGCAVEPDDAEPLPELEQDAQGNSSSNPGKGTGSASWTVVSGSNTLLFSASISNVVGSSPTLTGTPPPFSALPMSVTNSKGDTLRIEQVTIKGKRYRRYMGSFEITADAQQSASSCTECACKSPTGVPPCSPALSWTDCWSDGHICFNFSCATPGGGGGIVRLDLDFTATPGAPL